MAMKLVSTSINVLICTVGMMIMNDSTIETVTIPETVIFVLKNHTQYIINFFGGITLYFAIFSYFFNIEKTIYIENCYKKIQVQKEYCQYLNNLEEAVISKSNDGIRYFNKKGLKLI